MENFSLEELQAKLTEAQMMVDAIKLLINTRQKEEYERNKPRIINMIDKAEETQQLAAQAAIQQVAEEKEAESFALKYVDYSTQIKMVKAFSAAFTSPRYNLKWLHRTLSISLPEVCQRYHHYLKERNFILITGDKVKDFSMLLDLENTPMTVGDFITIVSYI